MSLHRRRVHWDYVEDCWACRVGTLQISPAAMVTRIEADPQYQHRRAFATEFENGDREAYRDLRRQGLQPPRIAGSAALAARASTVFEIETGHVARDPKALRGALQIAEDGGFDPLVPATAARDD